MRILLQWTTDPAIEAVEIDSSEWASLPKRPNPAPPNDPAHNTERITGQKGWVYYLNCQGVGFTADHYAVEDLTPGEVVEWVDFDGNLTTRVVPAGGGCRIIAWSDSPGTIAEGGYDGGFKNAKVYTFFPLGPDQRHGNGYNTQQCVRFYGESEVKYPSRMCYGHASPWSEFTPPDESITRHGKWVRDEALNTEHETRIPKRGWRGYIEGLPIEEIDHNGQLRGQRQAGAFKRNTGTRTFYIGGWGDWTHAAHTWDWGGGLGAGEFWTRAGGVQHTLQGNDDVFILGFECSGPGTTTWPTGNYRCQIDIFDIGADVTMGFGTWNSTAGHLARINSSNADQTTHAQTEGGFTTTGLQLATTGSVSWGSPATSDNFAGCLVGYRTTNHGNQAADLDQWTAMEQFLDGPWDSDMEDDIVLTESISAEKLTDGSTVEGEENDTVAVTDGVSAEMFFDRSQDDTAAVTDGVQAELTIEIGLSDTVTTTDSAGASFEIDRSFGDTVALDADVTTAEMFFDRGEADTVTTADNAATDLAYAREVNDTVEVSDTTTATLFRLLDVSESDTISVTDAAAASCEKAREVNDTIALDADVVATDLDYSRTEGDTVTVADTTAAEVTFERGEADTVTVADAVSATFEIARTASDTITLADAVTEELFRLIDVAPGDTVEVSDAAATDLEYNRGEADSVVTADAATTQIDYARELGDTVEVTDAANASFELAREASDTIAVSDAVAAEMFFERGEADSVVVSDAATTALEYNREANDTITTADTVDGSVSEVIEREVNDTVAVTESIVAAMFFERGEADTITTTDAAEGGLEYDATASDTITLTDTIARDAFFERGQADTVTVADTIDEELFGLITVSVGDSIVVTDTAVTALEYNRTDSDTVVITDAATVEVCFERGAADTVAVADSVTRDLIVAVIERSASDTVTTSDAATTDLAYARAPSDAVVITESTLAELVTPNIERVLADTVALVDGVLAESIRPGFPDGGNLLSGGDGGNLLVANR